MREIGWILILGFWIGLPYAGVREACARVLEVNVEAPEKVLVGDRFTVQVEVVVDGGTPPQPEPPSLPGLSVAIQPGFEFHQQINARISQIFRYVAVLSNKGPFEIRGFRAGGVEAAPVQVTALDPSEVAGARKSNPPVLAEALLDKAEVWQGEQVFFDFYVYYRAGQPDNLRANVDNILQPFGARRVKVAREETDTVVDGARYRKALVARYVLFPLEPGELTIPPIRLMGRFLSQARSGDPFDLFTNFGARDLDEVCRGPVLTKPLALKVKAIPQEGRPANFSGAVGSAFTFSANIPKREVAVGEPFTLTLKIRGTGSLDSVAEPALGLPEWIEVFDTERKSASDLQGDAMLSEISYDYVLIARKEGRVVLEPIPFSYFATGKGEYVTLKQGPFVLQVNPDEGQAITYLQGKRKRIRVTGEDFRHARTAGVALVNEGASVFESPAWWTLAVGPWIGFLGIVVKRKREEYLERHPDVSRRIRAKGAVKGRLARAEKLIAASGSEFHGEIENALHEFLSAQLGEATRGLTREQLREVLERRGGRSNGESGFALRLEPVLDRLDQLRFAPSTDNQTARREILAQARNLLAEMKRL